MTSAAKLLHSVLLPVAKRQKDVGAGLFGRGRTHRRTTLRVVVLAGRDRDLPDLLPGDRRPYPCHSGTLAARIG